MYCAAVLDVYSRRIGGWSIADHLRTELVVDASEMVRWRRRPVGTVVHSDRGALVGLGVSTRPGCSGPGCAKPACSGQWARVACAYDNSVMESFFGSMQIELLDRRRGATRADLANAIFEWIEAFYNPTRRHCSLGYLSPSDYETLHTPAVAAA